MGEGMGVHDDWSRVWPYSYTASSSFGSAEGAQLFGIGQMGGWRVARWKLDGVDGIDRCETWWCEMTRNVHAGLGKAA